MVHRTMLPVVLALVLSRVSAVVIHPAMPKVTPAPSADWLKRQDFEVSETTANPDNPEFQGYIDGDPNKPQSCNSGSTAFLQASGGFACCSGNCGSYTAPITCVTGGENTGSHTFGLTTNCADPIETQCYSYLYAFSDAQHVFAFCSHGLGPETTTIFATTTEFSAPPPTTTSSPYIPPSTSTPVSTPPSTQSQPPTSSEPGTSSGPATTSSGPSTPTQSTGSPIPFIPGTSTTGTPTPTPTPTPGGKSSSHVGAIAGGVVGGVVGIALIAGLIVFFLFRRRKNNNGRNDFSQDYYPRPDSPPPFPSNFPSGGGGTTSEPPLLPQPQLGTPSEKFSSIENVQAAGVSSATSPAMSHAQTASPIVPSGFGTGTNTVASSELQGSTQTNYPNRGDQASYDVHEMPAMSHKALPPTSPHYHELQ